MLRCAGIREGYGLGKEQLKLRNIYLRFIGRAIYYKRSKQTYELQTALWWPRAAIAKIYYHRK